MYLNFGLAVNLEILGINILILDTTEHAVTKDSITKMYFNKKSCSELFGMENHTFKSSHRNEMDILRDRLLKD